MMGGIQWAVTVTHIPTGMKQTITNRDMRSQHKAKLRAIHILTNRIHYCSLLDAKGDKTLNQHHYTVPDGDDGINELWEYKVKEG